MTQFQVTRAHLKNARDAKNWDLLDKLLEIDSTHINDASFYTDSWGEWWGLLLDCVYDSHEDGVRVLLKHGADKTVGNWGDCIPVTPKEAAAEKPVILALLTAITPPSYTRKSDPPLPKVTSSDDDAVNKQGSIRDQTGLVFQTDALKKKK